MIASGKQGEDSPLLLICVYLYFSANIYTWRVRLNELFQLNISNLTFIDNWGWIYGKLIFNNFTVLVGVLLCSDLHIVDPQAKLSVS